MLVLCELKCLLSLFAFLMHACVVYHLALIAMLTGYDH